MKKQTGITLIAVIVTVIVMLILAGVSINLAIGDNGIINNSQKSVQKTNISESKEYIIEAWGYVLGKYENIDEMDNRKISETVSPYFSNYMSSYGIGLLIGRNIDNNIFKVSFKLKGDEQENTFYIVNDKDVYEEKEFKEEYNFEVKDFTDKGI